jgi:hypothetical protein
MFNFLRERNRPFSELVLRLNINRAGPEALNQINSQRGHLGEHLQVSDTPEEARGYCTPARIGLPQVSLQDLYQLVQGLSLRLLRPIARA